MGQSLPVTSWKPRNTHRARELRNHATPAERLLWRYLSRGQLGAKFSRQMPIGPFFADFLCRETKLVIECDGISHDHSPERDQGRDLWITVEGYRVLRFTNAEVMRNVEGVVAVIGEKIVRLRALKTHPPIPSRKREGSSIAKVSPKSKSSFDHAQ